MSQRTNLNYHFVLKVMIQGGVMEPFLGYIEAPSLDILDCKSGLLV